MGVEVLRQLLVIIALHLIVLSPRLPDLIIDDSNSLEVFGIKVKIVFNSVDCGDRLLVEGLASALGCLALVELFLGGVASCLTVPVEVFFVLQVFFKGLFFNR